MSNYHCKSCKRDAKKNYRSHEFVPFGLTVENGWYEDETVFEVTDDNGDTTPMRTDEFNGRVGDQ